MMLQNQIYNQERKEDSDLKVLKYYANVVCPVDEECDLKVVLSHHIAEP